MDDGDDASYDPMKDPLLKPRRTTGPGWNYGYMVTPGNNNIVKCNICGKVTQGGIKRHKEHIAGTGGDAIGCPGVSTEVRREMIAYLEKNRRNQPIDLDEVVEVDAAGTSRVQYSTTRPSSGTAAKRNKRAFATKIKEHVAAKSVVSMLRKKPEVVVDERRSGCSQSTMESSTKTVEERHYVSMQWALFFYECGIPFNVASSRQFQIAIEASCQYGPGYKPPSPHELREPLLKDCVKETKLLRAKHEAAWKQYGCTLMSDGWSDRRGRHLINFLVNSPEGTFFLESVDASSECQDARMIADLLEKRIEDVGKENVVQVVTDNGANYKAAGKILMERIPTLYWSPCACHCLDLMLEDVGKLKEFKRPIARGKRVTNFIYRHGRILSLMRKATGGLDLVRPVGLVRPTGVKPCSQSYVNKVKGKLESMGCRIKTSCPVKSVSSFDGAGYRVLENDGSEETYDSVILGVHAPNALKVLGAEATHYELKILGACQYVNRDIYLHCDQNMMPQSPSAWSAWNFLGATSRGFSVTYWLNHIQEIESVRPFLVTLNPPCVPDHILLKWCTSLPVPSVAAAKAYLQFDQIQGKRGIWFCGAYDGHGFHEDGLKSGKAAAQGLLGKKCELLQNPKQMIPSWTEAGVRLIVARFLNQYISIGNLIMVEGGSVFSFGKVCDKCRVKSVMRVHDPLFYWKVATEGMFGLAEAYINGCFTLLDKREGLLNLILILIANRDARRSCSGARKGGRWRPYHLIAGLSYAKYFLRDFSRRNTATQTRRNISQHYDLSNDFFSLNMDKSMTYSCAIFKTESESLEAAQQRKLSLLIAKAKVEAGHHVLETGSGWGSLAIQVVKETGCKYTGVTLSEEQLKYSEKKVREAGLEEHITFLLCDYRQIPPCKYDAIISIEMIEHVGHEYMDGFFAVCESHLAEDGILALQFISIPEEQYDQFRKRPNFVKEYIFPGGCLPSLARVTSAMSTSSRFCIEHVENIGYNYYPTLMRWMDKFTANKDQVLAMGFDEKFIRIWEYYLIYSAAGCKSGAVRDYQVVFSRPGNPRLALRLDA